MTPNDAMQAANRAANAVMMLPRHQSWLCQALGWPAECHGKLLENAAFFVRVREFAVAEALYIELAAEKAKPWLECRPLVRAAFEVFCGTLKACDKLVPEAPAAPPTMGYLRDTDDEVAPGLDERI